MLNHLVIVGRLVEQPTTEEKATTITLAVPRSYKNENGEYETDFVPVQLGNDAARKTCEYCKKGDLVGIKGRLQTSDKLEVIATKVSFLSANKDLINEED